MNDRREQRRYTATLVSNLIDPGSRKIVRQFELAMWKIYNAMHEEH